MNGRNHRLAIGLWCLGMLVLANSLGAQICPGPEFKLPRAAAGEGPSYTRDSAAAGYLQKFDNPPPAGPMMLGAMAPNCPDLSGDGWVDLEDVAILSSHWLQTGSHIPGDFDENGQVSTSDLAYLVGHWLTAPDCAAYYRDGLPYMTSFESYQGFATNPNYPHTLDYQMGWKVSSGDASIKTAQAWVPELGQWVDYQLAWLDPSTSVTKEFNDTGTNHNYLRFQVVPGQESEIQILNNTSIVAGVKFGTNWHIYVRDYGSYVDTGINYQARRTGDLWTNLKLVMNWSGSTYEVFWNDDPNRIKLAHFNQSYSALTHVKLQTASADRLPVNRLSLSNNASGALTIDITSPCACDDDLTLQGRVPVLGTAWGENFGAYDLYFCPVDLDTGDINNWTKFETGIQVVNGGEMGYWDTGVIPNGLYYMGVVLFNDLGYPDGLPSNWFRIMWKTLTLNGQVIYQGPAQYQVTGDLKVNTFFQVEEPDISVPWPGQFPFELRRMYNNNQRFYTKPYRNGWTDGNHISLSEDTTYYYEWEMSGPFPVASWDENLLGIGHIWVRYPDGSQRLFTHAGGHDDDNPVIYRPTPDNGSEDYVERYSDSGGWPYVSYVYYNLKTRDGQSWYFRSDTFNYGGETYPDILCGGPYGTIQWSIKTGVESMADRFGNTLSFSWNTTETQINQIAYGSGATARTIKYYDTNSDGRYDEARLAVGTDFANPYRKVGYIWDPNVSVYQVKGLNAGVDADGVWRTDPNIISTVSKYQYDSGKNLVGISRGTDAITIGITYDEWGRVGQRRDYVESGNTLATNYQYAWFHPDPNFHNISHVTTVQSTAYQSVSSTQNHKGALLNQYVTVFDGSDHRDAVYFYADNNNPLKPTTIEESFDGRLRRTLSSYNSYGNPMVQTVYNDANQPVYTDFTWHPNYDLPTSQIGYQQANRTGKKVQTDYVYGKADGTIDAGSQNNKYLIQEKVLTATDPNVWAVTSYKYAACGLPSESTDPNSFRTVYVYDSFNYQRWVKVGPAGLEEKVRRYYYDGVGQKLLEANPRGGVTRTDYDGHGRVYRIRTYSDAAAFTINDATFIPTRYDSFTVLSDTTYGYDRKGNRTYEKKPDIDGVTGGKITTTYKVGNQPDTTSIYNYSGGSYILAAQVINTYNSRGLKTQEYRHDLIEGLDWYIQQDYDGLGRMQEARWYDYNDTSLLRKQEIVYNGQDKKARERLFGPEGLETDTHFYYDLFGRALQRVQDPNGLALTTDFTYDAAGNRISMVDPKDQVSYFAFDNANRMMTEYFTAAPGTPIGSAIVKRTTSYYPNNTVNTVTSYDTNGTTVLARTVFSYDQRGRVEKVTEDIDASNTAMTWYAYSDTGFGPSNAYHVRITDPGYKVTYQATDAFERTVKVLYPSGDYQEYEFNGDGSLKREAVWDGATKYWKTHLYEGHGRLARTTYPDGGYVTYGYNGFGRRMMMHDYRSASDNIGNDAQFDYDYDPLGRLSLQADQDNYQTAYTYRGDGQRRVIKVTPPGSGTAIYQVRSNYDAAGRLGSVQDNQLGTSDYVASLGYDLNGNRQTLTYHRAGTVGGNNTAITYSYNRENRLTGFSTTGGPTFGLASVTIDGLGRLAAGTETITKVGGSTASHVLGFGYDRRSELTSASMSAIGGSTWTGSYVYRKDGNIDSRTIQGSGTSFGYNGDLMTTMGANSLTWNNNGNLATGLSATYTWNYDKQLRSATLGANSQAAKYTPGGTRIWRQTVIGGTTTSRKLIVDETGEFPVVLLEINPANSQIIKSYIYARGELLLQRDGGMTATKYFYFHDRLGSVRELINTSGSVVNHYTFDPFGNALTGEVTEGVASPYRFANYYWEPVVSQYFCNARWYDPVLSRFTGRDPVQGNFQEPLTLHAYLYCMNNSVNATDPTGMVTKEEVITTTGTLGTMGGILGPRFAGMLQGARTFADVMSQRSMIYAQTVVDATGKNLNQWAQTMNRLGYEIHHIVGRGWGNMAQYDKDVLNSAQNLIALRPDLHAQITSFMNSGYRVHDFMRNNPDLYGKVSTLQQYIASLSYADQWRWNASILMHLATYGNPSSFIPMAYNL